METRYITVTMRRQQTRMERLRRRRERAVRRALVAALLLLAGLCIVMAAARLKETKAPAEAVTELGMAVGGEVREIPATVKVIAIGQQAGQAAESRYAPISHAERELIARVVYLEARGEPAAGQQAVAEVVLNRVAAENFPDSVEAVICQGGQFSTAPYLSEAAPGEAQYAAVDAALSGENILPPDVVYFSREGENDRVWGSIGNHVFCYQYIWE